MERARKGAKGRVDRVGCWEEGRERWIGERFLDAEEGGEGRRDSDGGVGQTPCLSAHNQAETTAASLDRSPAHIEGWSEVRVLSNKLSRKRGAQGRSET